MRLVDYVAPAYSTGAEQKWFNVGFTGSRSVAGTAGSRSAESARCVSGTECAVNTSRPSLTVQRDSTYLVVPVLCVIVYYTLNRISEVLVS